MYTCAYMFRRTRMNYNVTCKCTTAIIALTD